MVHAGHMANLEQKEHAWRITNSEDSTLGWFRRNDIFLSTKSQWNTTRMFTVTEFNSEVLPIPKDERNLHQKFHNRNIMDIGNEKGEVLMV